MVTVSLMLISCARRFAASPRTLAALSLCAGVFIVSAGLQSPPATTPQPAPAAEHEQPPAAEALPRPMSLTEALLQEIEAMHMELAAMRTELAQARLEAQSAQRERDELRQFVLDHERFGNDFAQYQEVKKHTEREARTRENEQARAQKEALKAERDARRAAARSVAQQRDAESDRLSRYRRMGFSPLGLDVFAGKMAFYYNTKESGGGVQVDYDTLIGNYLEPIPNLSEIDYSRMTISGSVLNASERIRNIGVAITFFDDHGNQVGHETIQINNARPDVPYPFTSKIDMALNRAFASSSTYVLYADDVE